MAAALFRRGTGLCCIQRELCRLVWRPQAALFSSKPPDRKPPRRTHIKKAKPQPAVDIAKLLEQLFHQHRPGTAPPVARPTKPPAASSMNVSASNVPPFSKTDPAASVPPAASSFKQVDARGLSSVTVPKTSASTAASLASEAAAVECRTSMETIETSVETATETVELETARRPLSDHETSSFPAASVEPLIEIPMESPVEHILSHPVEPSVEALAEEVQTKSTDVSFSAKIEPLIETTVESPVEAMGTLETRSAVVEGPVEPPIDVAARGVETESTDSGGFDASHTTTVEPLIETTVEPALEKSPSLLETLENRSAVAEGSVEATIEADSEALSVQTNSTDSGPVTSSHAAKEEPLIRTTIEPPVEASHSTMGTIETRAAAVEGPVEPPVEPPIDLAAQKVETKNTDSGPVHLSHAAKEEPLIETTIEPAVEASLVSEGTIEPAIETESGDNLSALIQNAEASAPLTLKNEPTIESVNAAVEGGNRSEEMTLESVTLHVDQVLVESFKIDELLQTLSVLDEKADKQVRGLLVQTEIGAESSSEDEREILTEVLSKWDSLSEDLREFEGESGSLVEELLCHAPPKNPRSVSPAADPPVGERTEETAGGAEAVKLESITSAEMEAGEVGGLEAEDLRETRNELEEEADAPAKEETVEVATAIDVETVFEETTEAESLTLDSMSEAADEVEAVEAVLSSERQEAGSGHPPGGVSEAMSLESVTLAEVEASLGTLEKESLSETTNLLEDAAEIIAGEQKTEAEDVVPPEETPGALSLAEDLQMEALMEELLFSVPAPVSGVTGDQVGRETGTADTSDAAVAAGSVDVDAAPEVKDDLKEVLLEEEVLEAEASGNEDGQETLTDLDPVQRLFLEKIKEYNNMSRLNGGLLEAEPDYEKYLSEETAKLRRLYGGGDLSSFPQFTFTEPQLDQDSK